MTTQSRAPRLYQTKALVGAALAVLAVAAVSGQPAQAAPRASVELTTTLSPSATMTVSARARLPFVVNGNAAPAPTATTRPGSTATPRPATATARPPTATPVPATSTPRPTTATPTSGPSPTPDSNPNVRHTLETATLDAGTMQFWRYLPADYGTDPNRKFPVIISVHGVGEISNVNSVKNVGVARRISVHNNDMCFTVNSVRDCFIVISPWVSSGWDVKFIRGAFDAALAMPNADPSRIYLTGLSMGGGMSFRFATNTITGTTPAQRYASKLAALVPLAAAAGDGQTASPSPCTIADANLPTWAIHDELDTTVGYKESWGWIDVINGVKPHTASNTTCTAPTPRAQFTATSGFGHNVWDTVYDPAQTYFKDGTTSVNLYHWLLLHHR
jgi:hypothetical protein